MIRRLLALLPSAERDRRWVEGEWLEPPPVAYVPKGWRDHYLDLRGRTLSP